jgi:hypothetical protein
MENTQLSKDTISFGLSLALCAVSNALLVVAKERSKAVADGMQKITGHHWVTHVAMILFLFVFFGWSIARLNGGRGPKMTVNRFTTTLVAGVVTGIVIVLGFYLFAD